MSETAATFINAIRDMIPDPTNPIDTATADGSLFRSATLVRMLHRSCQRVAKDIGWTVQDWFAMAQVANQSVYVVDEKWQDVNEGNVYCNQFPLLHSPLRYSIYPGRGTGRPLWYDLYRQTDHLELQLVNPPSAADAATTLAGVMTSTDLTATLTATTSFYSYGYVSIDSEIMAYEALTTSPIGLTALRRGCCGTTAASHLLNATVTHLGIWLEGPRTPADITDTTSTVELPKAFRHLIELDTLRRCRVSEQDDLAAREQEQLYQGEVSRIVADPRWRQITQAQIPAYGEGVMGPLVAGRFIRA